MVEPDELGIGHLFGRVRDAVVVGDARTGRILLWNPGAVEVFGYSRDEATTMSMEALVPPDLREAHRAGLRRFADTGGTVLVHDGVMLELPAVHRDGTALEVELTLTPLHVRPDQPLALAIIRDVTARAAAARSLAEAQASSERANQALRDFIAMVAHDLRGPLGAVTGFVSLLASPVPLSAPEEADFLARMGRQLSHMDEIIGDLMAATELETGSMQVTASDVDVAEAIARAIDACGGLADLGVTCEPGLTARVDPAHAVRCVANFLQNAVKHGKPPVTVDARGVGAEVEIRVGDAGDGLDADDAERVFDRFARAAQASTRPGLGLGLTIVRGLAEANGGGTWYEPNQPSGACFVLRFPQASHH